MEKAKRRTQSVSAMTPLDRAKQYSWLVGLLFTVVRFVIDLRR